MSAYLHEYQWEAECRGMADLALLRSAAVPDSGGRILESRTMAGAIVRVDDAEPVKEVVRLLNDGSVPSGNGIENVALRVLGDAFGAHECVVENPGLVLDPDLAPRTLFGYRVLLICESMLDMKLSPMAFLVSEPNRMARR